MPGVVVLGSSGFDLTVRLPRLPRPGETLLGGELLTGPGGKGANQAIAARRAGAEVAFVTAFGDDDFGRRVLENDRGEGIDLTHAKVVPGVSNQVALIFVGGDGQNLIGVAPGASVHLTPDDIDRLPAAIFRPGAVFLASLEVPLETVARGLARARAAGLTTVLNPAPADVALLKGGILPLVDVLTPNQEEAQVLTGRPTVNARDAALAARDLQVRAGARDVVITLGHEGCLVVADGIVLVPSHQVDAVDTVGAGDAFNGALAVALAEGRPLVAAAAWACAAGALAVTRPGAQGALPRRPEIDRLAATARTPPMPLP
jgi:ribokinase